MFQELQRVGFLYQETVVYDIASRFGEEFTQINTNGNIAIGKEVLLAFRELSGNSVVWERGERMWRKRQSHDEPGRGNTKARCNNEGARDSAHEKAARRDIALIGSKTKVMTGQELDATAWEAQPYRPRTALANPAVG